MKKNNTPQATSPLSTWLSYLKNLHNKTVDMGLTRISQVAARLNLLKPAPIVFTITGTNGKGSTCCILEAILVAAGYRIGVYSSPHLLRYTERIRVQKAELSESAHTTSFAEIEAVRGDISLTYFEYGTLSALWLFKKAQLDVVILEVGLGGRLDATNIVDADVAVITNIALDHTDWLGMDRESIGREKAGIFRAGKLAVIGESDIPNTIIKIAQEKEVRLLRYGIDWQYTVIDGAWHFSDIRGKLVNLPMPHVPQPNAASALAALRASNLIINEQSIYDGIRDAILPGRFQIVNKSPLVILDVAHNPHAAAYLAERLASLPKIGRVLTVIGMYHDKDIGKTLSCMESAVDFWYCASLNVERGASAEQLMKYLNQSEAYANVELAWKAAMAHARPEDTVLVCGSFYTVACVMHVINVKNNNK